MVELIVAIIIMCLVVFTYLIIANTSFSRERNADAARFELATNKKLNKLNRHNRLDIYPELATKDVLKRENMISKCPKNSFYYAAFNINKRFKKGEKAIKKNKYYKRRYERRFGVQL